MATRRGAGVLGALVVGGSVALAEVLIELGRTGPGAVEAVADGFIDLSPPWLTETAISVFGAADRVALGIGIVVVMGVLGVVAGRLEARRRGAGALLVLAQGLLGAVAIITHPQGDVVATWPVLASALVGALGLSALLAPERPPDPERAMADRRVLDRRALLLSAGAIGAGAVAAAGVSRTVAARRPEASPVLPTPVETAEPVPPEATLDVPGLTPFRTPNTDFYRIDTAFFVPRVSTVEWELRVSGMVDREIRMTWEDLLAEPMVEAWVTLACVSNPVGGDLVGNALWLGWPVRELLARAGVQPGADMVLSRSIDGFSASTPLPALTDERDSLIAVGMNGRPLPAEHGFPVRLVVPGLYGYVSATKWLTELEVTRFADATAYWTERGWSARGPVKLSSRIDTPTGRRDVSAGEVAVAGVAWAQHTGIAAVEVRVDEGPWRPARLAEEVTIDSWRQWVYPWDATPGEHTLEVRATDRDGQVQTGVRTGTVPDGATGWHRVDVTVV